MNIQDYIEHGRHLYAEFSNLVADILSSTIDNNEAPIGVQQIQNRAKSIKSLSIKLSDREKYHSEDIETEIKDLAGCRVIFYHSDDLSSFLNSGMISDNFDVDWDQSNFHHPDQDAQDVNDYYMANHFVVSLTTERLALPEFSKFSGLRCEIQVQTLLNHAWAETAHDITYKPRETAGFGSRLRESIDARLKTIMTDYLRPAGYEFQKIKHDFNQLLQGEEIFNSEIKNNVEAADDNNVLYDLLERYKDYVLPNYSDYVPYTDEIYDIVSNSLAKARSSIVVDIETPYGTIGGKSYKEVLSVCLDILSYVRYLDVTRTQSLLLNTYKTIVDHSEEEICIEHIERFAGYHYEVAKRSGLWVQDQLLRELLLKPIDEIYTLSGYVVPVCRAILQPSFQRTEWTHENVTIETINLSGDEALKAVRENAIELLTKLCESEVESIRSSAISCLFTATDAPNMGSYSDELLNIILSNSNDVIQICTNYIERQSFPEIQICEKRISFLYSRANQVSQDDRKQQDARTVADTTIQLVGEYRARINSSDDYFKYKVLVGFRSIFDQEWENGSWGYKEKEKFRNEKVSEFVDSVNDDDYTQWADVITKCTQTESSDLATFPYFHKFLSMLAASNPDFALRLLRDNETGVERFLASILLGFVDSGRQKLLDSVIDELINRGERLWECARLFVLKPNANRSLLPKIFEAAKQNNQVAAMHQLVAAVIKHGEEDTAELATLFLPIISELTSSRDSNWIHETWFLSEANKLLESLSEDHVSVILENLVFLKEIDYHAEHIISFIANRYPSAVVNYFGARLLHENQTEEDDRYDAIPYSFQILAEPLSTIPECVVDTVLSWYSTDPTLFQYRGGMFLKNVFPNFDDQLEAKLISLIRSDGDETAEFIISILRNYEGQIFIHNVCKELVVTLPGDSNLLSEIRIALQESGVVHGEFGFVELCERKKGEVIDWLEDANSKIKRFAEVYVRSLDRQKATEQKRAEEELEMRKHRFGE